MLETRIILTAGEYTVIGDETPIVLSPECDDENADELAGWLARFGK
jgi:hypothetical protein